MNKFKKTKKTNINKVCIKSSLKLKKRIKKYINKKFFSNQTKQALFYAIEEARNNEDTVLTPKYLFLGILRANRSVLSNIFKIASEKYIRCNDDINYLVNKCRFSIKCERLLMYANGQIPTLEDSRKLILSKSVRDLFKSLLSQPTTKIPLISEKFTLTNRLDFLQKSQFKTITTFLIFKELIKNESIKVWFRDEIFLQKK